MDKTQKVSDTFTLLLQSGEFSQARLREHFTEVQSERDPDYLELSDLLCDLLPEERGVMAEAYRGFANAYDYRCLLDEMHEVTQGAWSVKIQVVQHSAEQVVISLGYDDEVTEITAQLDGLGSLDLDALFAVVKHVHQHSEIGFVVSPAGEAYMLFTLPCLLAQQLNDIWL